MEVAVEPEVTNTLKVFWEDMLNHAANEPQDGESDVLDLSGFMVAIPVPDGGAVVALDAMDRDRRGGDILGEIFRESLTAGRNIPFFEIGDKAFRVVFPPQVDGFFYGRFRDVMA